MKNLFIATAFSAIGICCLTHSAHAQSGTKAPKTMTPKSATVKAKSAAMKPKQPWALSGRIHLEKGTNKGYLVVQLDLATGHHVYSLSPKGSPFPTKLTVAKSNDLRMLGDFASEKPPVVIEKDPVFNRRMEKHKGVVQFFAPIEVRPGIDLKKLSQEIKFTGQICSDQGCQPVQDHLVKAAFAGYFELPAARNAKDTKAATRK